MPYHVNDKGEAGRCGATKGHCPFGDADEHYSSLEAARFAFEANQDDQAHNTSSKIRDSELQISLAKAPGLHGDTLIEVRDNLSFDYKKAQEPMAFDIATVLEDYAGEIVLIDYSEYKLQLKEDASGKIVAIVFIQTINDEGDPLENIRNLVDYDAVESYSWGDNYRDHKYTIEIDTKDYARARASMLLKELEMAYENLNNPDLPPWMVLPPRGTEASPIDPGALSKVRVTRNVLNKAQKAYDRALVTQGTIATYTDKLTALAKDKKDIEKVLELDLPPRAQKALTQEIESIDNTVRRNTRERAEALNKTNPNNLRRLQQDIAKAKTGTKAPERQLDEAIREHLQEALSVRYPSSDKSIAQAAARDWLNMHSELIQNTKSALSVFEDSK